MGAGNDKLLTISCHPGKQNKKHETTNEEEDSMSNLNNVMKEFKAFILKGNIIEDVYKRQSFFTSISPSGLRTAMA